MVRHWLKGVLALLIAVFFSCVGEAEKIEFKPGELTASKFQEAARNANYATQSIEVEIPIAVRPGVKFRTRPWGDSLLIELRERYDLAGLIDSVSSEWDAQQILCHWLHQQIENGTPEVDAGNAIEILDAAADGQKFWCSYYAISYVQCALALGWQARKISLDHYHEPGGVGSRHHGAAEVWSNQFAKWIYIDPQSDLHFEKNGVPLAAWEIRGEWLADSGASVAHVVGGPSNRTEKNPAIVWWDLEDEDETALFFWLIYHDSYATWEAGSPSPFYTPVDSFTQGKTWYQGGGEKIHPHSGYELGLFEPVEDITQIYWTVGVVETKLAGLRRGEMDLSFSTWMPDFMMYEVSVDGGGWEKLKRRDSYTWKFHMGLNGISIRAVNKAGVSGPKTTLVVR